MSTDFNSVCFDCKKAHHLGQRMGQGCSFGYRLNDESGRKEAAEFIFFHLGHDLRVMDTDAVPDEFLWADEDESYRDEY